VVRNWDEIKAAIETNTDPMYCSAFGVTNLNTKTTQFLNFPEMRSWLTQKETANFCTYKSIWLLEGGLLIEPASLAAETAEHHSRMGLPPGIDGIPDQTLFKYATENFKFEGNNFPNSYDVEKLDASYKQFNSWCNGGNIASLFNEFLILETTTPEWTNMMNYLEWFGAKQTKIAIDPITMPLEAKPQNTGAATEGEKLIQAFLRKREKNKPIMKLENINKCQEATKIAEAINGENYTFYTALYALDFQADSTSDKERILALARE
jgi:hypothetical protein